MTFWRSLAWSTGVFGGLSLLATLCWLTTGDWSWDIGVTFALIPNLLAGIYLGYRMVRARVGELMPFVAAVVCTVPALALGWSGYQVARHELGKRLGPLGVEKYARLKHRNAVVTRLRGRFLWKDGITFKVERGGAKVKYTLLPFVSKAWQKGDPVKVWVLGTTHRYKEADFDGCGYPKSEMCTVKLYEPRLRDLRLQLLWQGVGRKRGGGLDFVVLRSDRDRLWLPKRLAAAVGPAWLLLFTFWIRRMSRRRESSE
jgi:hypothetical protein